MSKTEVWEVKMLEHRSKAMLLQNDFFPPRLHLWWTVDHVDIICCFWNGVNSFPFTSFLRYFFLNFAKCKGGFLPEVNKVGVCSHTPVQ